MIDTAKKFLKQSENSRLQEDIYKHKLIFDLKIAAASKSKEIHCFEPDVDKEGFDLIFTLEGSLRPIQTKTVIGKTDKWKIHNYLLRPSDKTSGLFLPEQPTAGLEGGVVVIDLHNLAKPSYYYTDVYVTTAIKLGLYKTNLRTQIKTFEKHLCEQTKKQILTRKILYVRAKGPAELLSLMGLIDFDWRQNILAILDPLNYHEEKDVIEDKKFVKRELLRLCH